jgi:hypothetical protein
LSVGPSVDCPAGDEPRQHSTGEKSARTVASPDGLLIANYSVSRKPLGVEITAPRAFHLIASTSSSRILASRPRTAGIQARTGRRNRACPMRVMTRSSPATLHHRVEHALTRSLGRLDLLAVPGERPDRGVHALLEREDLPVTRPRRRHYLADPVARQPRAPRPDHWRSGRRCRASSAGRTGRRAAARRRRAR